MKYYLVYQTTNNITNKIYIGCHITDNPEDSYLGSGDAIRRAIKKYGRQSFKKTILYWCANAAEMFEQERKIVTEEFVNDSNTYNARVGGCGGTPEYMRQISPFANRHLITEDMQTRMTEGSKKGGKITGNKMKQLKRGICSSEWHGRPHTTDTKQKIGRANSIKQRGCKNSNYGKTWIHSLKERKSVCVSKHDLDDYLRLGWIKGRKMCFE